MNISNKILELRTNAKLSQGDLAEKVGVSRQSISKWETGASVPDLDKILLVSKIFDVSVDFLVKDEIEFTKNKEENSFAVNLKSGDTVKLSTQKIVGIILLAVGLIGLLLSFIVPVLIFISALMLVTGILIFTIKKYAALKIGWTYAVLITLFSTYFFGGTFRFYFTPQFYMHAGKINILMSILAFVCYGLLFWRTIVKFKSKTTKLLSFLCCTSLICLLNLINDISTYISLTIQGNKNAAMFLFSGGALIFTITYILIILLTTIFTLRYYYKNK